MARLTFILTLFAVLIICAVHTDAKRRRGMSGIAGRGSRRVLASRQNSALENQLNKEAKQAKKPFIGILKNIINKILIAIGLKDKKTEKPDVPEATTAAANTATAGTGTTQTQTTQTAGTTQTQTTQTAGTEGTTQTASTTTTTVP